MTDTGKNKDSRSKPGFSYKTQNVQTRWSPTQSMVTTTTASFSIHMVDGVSTADLDCTGSGVTMCFSQVWPFYCTRRHISL